MTKRDWIIIVFINIWIAGVAYNGDSNNKELLQLRIAEANLAREQLRRELLTLSLSHEELRSNHEALLKALGVQKNN